MSVDIDPRDDLLDLVQAETLLALLVDHRDVWTRERCERENCYGRRVARRVFAKQPRCRVVIVSKRSLVDLFVKNRSRVTSERAAPIVYYYRKSGRKRSVQERWISVK